MQAVMGDVQPPSSFPRPQRQSSVGVWFLFVTRPDTMLHIRKVPLGSPVPLHHPQLLRIPFLVVFWFLFFFLFYNNDSCFSGARLTRVSRSLGRKMQSWEVRKSDQASVCKESPPRLPGGRGSHSHGVQSCSPGCADPGGHSSEAEGHARLMKQTRTRA